MRVGAAIVGLLSIGVVVYVMQSPFLSSSRDIPPPPYNSNASTAPSSTPQPQQSKRPDVDRATGSSGTRPRTFSSSRVPTIWVSPEYTDTELDYLVHSAGVPRKAIKERVPSACARSSESTAASTLPNAQRLESLARIECPPFRLWASEDDDRVLDRRRSWVEHKYKLYASRCRERNGVMWKELTRETHDKILARVLQVANISLLGENAVESHTAVLDWGSGCGVSMDFLAQRALRSSKVQFRGIGIDVTPEAVNYSRAVYSNLRDHVLFCHADGTDLSWLPSNSFDLVISFGALLHVPVPRACATVNHIVRVLRPGGLAWAGYIDNRDTLSKLLQCPVDCDGSTTVTATTVSEATWFAGDGVPKGNRKRKARSILWRKNASIA